MRILLAFLLAVFMGLVAVFPVYAAIDGSDNHTSAITMIEGEDASTYQFTVYATVQTLQDSVSVQAIHNPDNSSSIVELINKQRADSGLGELVWDDALKEAALIRALEITQKWSHTRPNGTMVDTLTGERVGENLAKGYDTPSSATEAWMDSESHRANILYGKYTRTAVACVEYDGKTYWVQLFGL